MWKIILSYIINNKKHIKEWGRRKKGLCVGCGAPPNTSDWSIYGISSKSNKIRCDLCNTIQPRPIKKEVKNKLKKNE